VAVKHYINLTNGIEAIPRLVEKGLPFSYIRIQSSQCEAKNWLKVLEGIDYDFLMNCALGNTINVYDYSQRKDIPRALFQGLSLIEYVLNRRWYGKIPDRVLIKTDIDVTEYFDMIYNQLFVWNQNKEKSDMKRKIDYFKKFLLGEEVHIVSFPFVTEHDSDNDFYREIIIKMKENVYQESNQRQIQN
jgi:hypothetical protein